MARIRGDSNAGSGSGTWGYPVGCLSGIMDDDDQLSNLFIGEGALGDSYRTSGSPMGGHNSCCGVYDDYGECWLDSVRNRIGDGCPIIAYGDNLFWIDGNRVSSFKWSTHKENQLRFDFYFTRAEAEAELAMSLLLGTAEEELPF